MINRRTALAGLLTAGGIGLSTTRQSVAADEFSEETVVKEASSQLVEGLLEALDLEFEEKENGTYAFEMDGTKTVLFNKGKDAQLYCGFTGKRVTLSRINEWNRKKRFSRAYLDQDNDAVLEADIDFEGGVTGETLLRFFRIFALSAKEFQKHIA